MREREKRDRRYGELVSYPNKASWEPALTVQDASPPPLLVGGIHYLDDVPRLEAQLLVVHGDMVPQGLGVHTAAITDQLGRGNGEGTDRSTQVSMGGFHSDIIKNVQHL